MKKIFLLTLIASLFMACSSPTASTEAGEANEAATAEAFSTEYAVNAVESTVTWTGSKPTGDMHMGTVAIKQGKLAMSEGSISAGSFVLDMTQMSVTDEGMDEETKAKLLGHLTTTDFFEVEKFPTASFSVTSSTADSLMGNLTIKDITKSITVPYSVEVGEANITANASFSIDRTQWGVKFNSGNFFENLGEYLIDDAVQFDVKLVADAK
ncbi:YceI family protein [Bacteroidia bacterium]|jgi:polyisoprenoid-binding protein YceI|nr:YceI family protein [Bacteroidia bacterium]